MNIPERKISRRNFGFLLTGVAVGGAVGYGARDVMHQRQSDQDTPGAALNPQVISIFDTKQANEAAEEENIYFGSFFTFEKETIDNLSAFSASDRLYPIYPPAVHSQKDLIYNLSDEFQIPPNVVAAIMSIESAGYEQAESYVGAQGLFQVMPFHFPEEIQENPAAMKAPFLNGKTGMKYFTECIAAAREEYPDLDADGAAIYARAMIAYNAGQGSISDAFSDLPEESKFYGDHFIRYAMIAEVAEALRKKGNNDIQIIDKLVSREINARAYALKQYRIRSGGYTYDQYMKVLQELAKPIPGIDPVTKKVSENGAIINSDYITYLNSSSQSELPISAALRIWFSLGGEPLFVKDPKNIDIEEWAKINTQRN